MNTCRWSFASCVACSLLLGSRPAAAEVSSAQRATAEALFQQAAQLMDQKRFSEACEKFAASQELDAGLGTMLYLADCYEQAGRAASAWALFREAEDAAKRAEQPDREHIAGERATSLEARLSKLELRVPAARRVPGLELRLNDAPVPSASWNVPLPVDPGSAHVEARAPGKKPWTVQVTIADGPANQVVEVQPLLDAPRSAPAESTQPLDRPLPPASGSGQRIAGYVVGAVGVVALAAGGFFGYRTYSLNRRSKGDCRADDPNACTPAGASLRDDAKTAGTISTIATLGGGALILGGVSLVLTAPSGAPARAGNADPKQASLTPFGLQLSGVW
ncbi:MAG TPA: tetratricopeptide repeat protein [Polyangiaceae bacterium]